MPKDLALRISYFYCASALSGAFSGLLAAAIAKMDGIGGLEGWRWIFILEGLLSVVLGVMCFFLLIDTPAFSTRWLSAEEIRFLELSMFIKQGGVSSEESNFKMRDLKKVLQNWRIYVQAYFLLCQSALSYGKAILRFNFNFLLGIQLTRLPVIRNQIHPSNHHQSNGLQFHQRPTNLRPTLRRRSHLSHHLRPTVRPLLLAHALRSHPHGNRDSRLRNPLLSQRRPRSQARSSLFRSRPRRGRYLSHPIGRRIMEREQHCPIVATGHWYRADELRWKCWRHYWKFHVY